MRRSLDEFDQDPPFPFLQRGLYLGERLEHGSHARIRVLFFPTIKRGHVDASRFANIAERRTDQLGTSFYLTNATLVFHKCEG